MITKCWCASNLIIAFALVPFVMGCHANVVAKEPLKTSLDRQGPYVILVSQNAQSSYSGAIARARTLHPDAELIAFDPADLDTLFQKLRSAAARYALIFVMPNELDVNFGWRWLQLATQLDDDPFVDLRTGFVTGATPEAAEAFVKRIAAAARGELQLPGKLVDNLGPNTQAGKKDFFETPLSYFLPGFGERFGLKTISHGPEGFSDERLRSMADAGLIHFGGHGHPDRVDDGLRGVQAGKLALSPCVVFNGCCYTGVTHRWFEQWTANGKVAERTVAAPESFCLSLLSNQAVAYFAALHPDHGIPVYQEMEYLGFTGDSLGSVMKYTYDGVVLGSGGKLTSLEPFRNDSPSPTWAPGDMMLKGTAARVLFGDPALIVGEPFLKPPYEISISEADNELLVTAIKSNSKLLSTYTDTYHADLAWNANGFNDRALISVSLPASWNAVSRIAVVSVTAGDKQLQNRLVGFAVEQDGADRRLHVQVDVPTTGYMQSDFRSSTSTVVFKAMR